MADFDELLDVTKNYLKSLKSGGAEFLVLSEETRRAIQSPAVASGHSARLQPPRGMSQPSPAVAVASARPEPDAKPDETSILLDAHRSGADLSPEAKVAAMRELRERALLCQKCVHLARSRKNVVFGVGDIHADLMFVGEAPGADEDEQGEPFVGRVGQLLTRIIETMGFSRQSVYIANVLKCRPDTPGQSAGNRKPTPDEMKTCLPYLLAQVELIQPKIMVALGGTAMEGLFGKPCFITRVRGQFHEFRGIPVMPTYHPSYLLRNQSMQVKRQVWEDMLSVMEKLGLPITAKQRNYFLKS